MKKGKNKTKTNKTLEDKIVTNVRQKRPHPKKQIETVRRCCIIYSYLTSSPIMLNRDSASLLVTVSPIRVPCLNAWWVHSDRGKTFIKWLYVAGFLSSTRSM